MKTIQGRPWALRYLAAFLFLTIIVCGNANRADADSTWWFGSWKPVSSQVKSVTGFVELSPDYIFFSFGKDVGLQWQDISCGGKSCLFKIVEPKSIRLKSNNRLCAGGKAVRYVHVKRAGRNKVDISYLTSESTTSACLTGSYRPRYQ